MNPHLPHILYLANGQSKYGKSKSIFRHGLLKILVTIICLVINKPLKNNISLEIRIEKIVNVTLFDWLLRKQDIALVSQKRWQIWETNILENSYNVFYIWLKFYYYLDK